MGYVIVVDKFGNAIEPSNPFPVTDSGLSDGTQKTTIQTLDEDVGVQNPLQTDGDSVYLKDIWVDQSTSTNWTDEDGTGLDPSLIPFTNLHTRIHNSTTDNPKILTIHFNRTVFATQVGLGCVGAGEDFSNVVIKLLGSGGTERTLADDSANNNKYTSRNYTFPQQLFNAVQLEFHTTDTVCLSNITIQKTTQVSVAQVEPTTNSLKVIPYAHGEIHSGDHFFDKGNATLGNGASFDVLVVTPDAKRWAHTTFGGTGEDGEVTIELFENTITSDDGVRSNERNRNRNFADNNTTFVYLNPTITTPGDSLGQNIFGEGKASGGGERDTEEILLKQNTKYLFRITNNTVSNNTVNWVLDWYEHTNKGEPV